MNDKKPKKLKVIELSLTCDACPTQWEGKTDDGEFLYIRYRFGNLTVGLGKTIDEAVMNKIFEVPYGESLDGLLTATKMKKLTKSIMDFYV